MNEQLDELTNDQVIRLVLNDARQCFRQNDLWLEVDQVDVISSIGVLRGAAHVGAMWTLTGRNVRDDVNPEGREEGRQFLGLKATDRPIVIHGLTLIHPDPDKGLDNPRYQRLIDWDEVYVQLGMLPGRQVSG